MPVKATVQPEGKTATGIEAPSEVVEGHGQR